MVFSRFLYLILCCVFSFSSFAAQQAGSKRSLDGAISSASVVVETSKAKREKKSSRPHKKEKATKKKSPRQAQRETYSQDKEGLAAYVSEKNLDKLSMEDLNYWREFIQRRAQRKRNFVYDRVAKVYVLNLGVRARDHLNKWGLNFETGQLQSLAPSKRKRQHAEAILGAFKYCAEHRLLGNGIREKADPKNAKRDKEKQKIVSWANSPTLYSGKNSVKDFSLPWFVMQGGKEYELPHGEKTEIEGLAQKFIFQPSCETRHRISTGVLMHRDRLHAYVETVEEGGNRRKSYLYSYLKVEGEEQLLPVVYYNEYTVEWFPERPVNNLKITYKEDDGSDAVDIYNLVVNVKEDDSRLYYYLLGAKPEPQDDSNSSDADSDDAYSSESDSDSESSYSDGFPVSSRSSGGPLLFAGSDDSEDDDSEDDDLEDDDLEDDDSDDAETEDE